MKLLRFPVSCCSDVRDHFVFPCGGCRQFMREVLLGHFASFSRLCTFNTSKTSKHSLKKKNANICFSLTNTLKHLNKKIFLSDIYLCFFPVWDGLGRLPLPPWRISQKDDCGGAAALFFWPWRLVQEENTSHSQWVLNGFQKTCVQKVNIYQQF